MTMIRYGDIVLLGTMQGVLILHEAATLLSALNDTVFDRTNSV